VALELMVAPNFLNIGIGGEIATRNLQICPTFNPTACCKRLLAVSGSIPTDFVESSRNMDQQIINEAPYRLQHSATRGDNPSP
jgi:hypothetical protein